MDMILTWGQLLLCTLALIIIMLNIDWSVQ